MFNGIEHTAIATPNPEALANWYAANLEMPIVHTYDGNYFVRAADGTMLEIIPSEGEALDAKIKTPGIRHLAISVDDFEAGVAEIEAKGIEILNNINVKGNRLAFFHDLDGNIIHLIWREKSIG